MSWRKEGEGGDEGAYWGDYVGWRKEGKEVRKGLIGETAWAGAKRGRR